MINSLVTILIPTNNSVDGLKTTIESILLQTKIKGTRVLVLDYGSDDGSFQFSAYASSEYKRILKIESIDLSKNAPEFEILTPYCLCISPGVIFENKDFLIDVVNSKGKENRDLIYYRGIPKNPLVDLFPYYFLKKGQIGIGSIFCNKERLWKIENEKTKEGFTFILKDKINKDLHKAIGMRKSSILY